MYRAVRFCGVAVMAFVAILRAPALAPAGFVAIDHFDQLTPGEINGQSVWSATVGIGTVVLDPTDPTNQVLELAPFPGTLAHDTLIADGTERMLFMRFRFEDQQNLSFGMSHLSSPKEFSDFGPELRKSDATDHLKIHDGQNYEDLTNLQPDTWYNVWAWINAQADETQVWLHSREGEPAAASDQLSSRGETVFDFRTSTTHDLINFYVKSSAGGGKAGPFWIDDIYLEDSNALNFANPSNPTLLGDFNEDGMVNVVDIDLLSGAIVNDPANVLFDLDESGIVDHADLDIMIHEVLNTSLGDANLDREFTSADFVLVLQAGKYEQELNAGWAEGDWTADLRFNSSDFVAAMQEGAYEQGPPAVARLVPEPGGVSLAMLACFALLFSYRAGRSS